MSSELTESPISKPWLRIAFAAGGLSLALGMAAGVFESVLREGGLPTIRFSNLADIEGLMEAGRVDEAVSRLEMTLRLVSLNQHVMHNMLGNALRAQGRDDEALQHYRAAVDLRPDFLEARNNLAVALIRADRYEDGFAEFERTLRLDPAYDVARRNLSIAVARYEQWLAGAPDLQGLALLRAARALLSADSGSPDRPGPVQALTHDHAITEIGRRCAAWFFDGELDALRGRFSPALAARMDAGRLDAFRRQFEQRLGREVELVGEDVVEAAAGWSYRRLSRFEGFDGVVELTFDLLDDETVEDFGVRLGETER